METLIRFYDFLVILIFRSLALSTPLLPSFRPPSVVPTPLLWCGGGGLADGLMVTPVSAAPRAPTNDTFLCEFSASAFSRRPLSWLGIGCVALPPRPLSPIHSMTMYTVQYYRQWLAGGDLGLQHRRHSINSGHPRLHLELHHYLAEAGGVQYNHN